MIFPKCYESISKQANPLQGDSLITNLWQS
jgi:hypothetical protein